MLRLGRFGDTIPSGRNGAVAQMGRSGDTMVCGFGLRFAHGCRSVPLGTLCDTMRWAWFGPGCQTIALWCYKAAVVCTASKVGQGLGPQRLSALMVTSVAPVVIAKKRVEIPKARSGEERATGHHHLYRGCHAAIVLRGRYVGRGEGVQAAHGWRPGLAAKPDPLDAVSTVGTDHMGRSITMGCADVQRLTRRCSCSSSGRIIRCGCQFQAEPVHGACW